MSPEKTQIDLILDEVKEKGTSKICRSNGDTFVIMTAEDFCKLKEESESLKDSVMATVESLGVILTKVSSNK